MNTKGWLSRSSEALFGEGWPFLVPFLGLYLSAGLIGVSAGDIRVVFQAISLALLFFLVTFIGNRARAGSCWDIVFWSALSLALLIPGAYLEFPGDPWEHIKRIYMWKPDWTIKDHPFWSKSGYFLYWTWIGELGAETRGIALDLISAGSQLLLAYQAYLFARRLGNDVFWSRAFVIAFLLLFGNSAFSFRYYALSATPLAYTAYLAALRVLVDLYEAKPLDLHRYLKLAALLLLMLFNHAQEVGLFAISALGMILARKVRPSTPHAQLRLAGKLSIVYAIAYVLGFVVLTLFASRIDGIRSALAEGHLSRLGATRVWAIRMQYLEALALHGLAALWMAWVYLRKHRLLATWTLMPVLLLLFPPFTILAFGLVEDRVTVYRTLYAIPMAFMLLTGLREMLPRQRWAPVAILIAIAAVPWWPVRGRLFAQFYPVPDTLALRHLEPLLKWSLENPMTPACRLASDRVTLFYLNAHLGIWPGSSRWEGLPGVLSSASVEDFRGSMAREGVCRILVARSEEQELRSSILGPLSRHWGAWEADMGRATPAEFAAYARGLGWKHSHVEPFYDVYDRP
jgi:hypothetical protein